MLLNPKKHLQLTESKEVGVRLPHHSFIFIISTNIYWDQIRGDWYVACATNG